MSPRTAYVLLAIGIFVTLFVFSRTVAKEQARDIATASALAARSGCERTNAFRRESNRRIAQHKKNNEATLLVAEGARDARLAAFRRDGEQSDLQAYRTYVRAVKLLKGVEYREVEIVDCEEAYPLP